jgi:hypothetical protein
MFGRYDTLVDCDSFRKCLRCHVIFWERADQIGLVFGGSIQGVPIILLLPHLRAVWWLTSGLRRLRSVSIAASSSPEQSGLGNRPE